MSTNAGGRSPFMKIFPLPPLAAHFHSGRPEDLVQGSQRRPLPVAFPNQTRKIIPDQLIYGCISIQCHFASGPQQIFIKGQSEIPLHIISVALVMCTVELEHVQAVCATVSDVLALKLFPNAQWEVCVCQGGTACTNEEIWHVNQANNIKPLQKQVEAREYQLEEAVPLLQKIKFAKFDETVEFHMRLGVDPKHADQMVRGTVVHAERPRQVEESAGHRRRRQTDAKPQEAGADLVGGDDMVNKIQTEGWTDFDAVIATPDMMRSVGKLGKVLGPARPDAESQDRHGDHGRRQGGQGNQSR